MGFVRVGSTTVRVRVTHIGVLDMDFTAQFSDVLGNTHTWGIIHRGAGTGNQIELWRNGLFIERRASSNFNTTTNTYINIGVNNANNLGAVLQNLQFFRLDASSKASELTSNPYALLMPVSRPVYFDMGGGGGGGFTETLDSLIASIASVTDQQAYQAVVDTLITAGATIQSVADMLEALLSLGQSTSQTTAAQDYADAAQTTATEQASAAAAQNYADAAQTTAQESATTGSAQDYTDAATTVVVEQSGVTEQLIGAGAVETLLTVATSAAQASAAQAFVETLTTIAQSASSLSQVATLTEAIGTTIASITTANDRQLFVENLAIVAISSSSLAEIGAYIEQVASAASSQATLTDVLVGQFVGRYLMVDYARPRNFIDLARPRNFIDLARPRSFIDYARPRSRRTLQ